MQRFEEICPLSDGSKKHFFTIKAPLSDGANNVIGLVGLSLDITENKQAEIAKTEFLENMSHDLRTPFSGIISLSEYLYSSEQDSGRKELLGEILNSGKHLLTLLNEVLELSKQGAHPVNITTLNIAEVVEETLALLHAQARHKSLEINVICPTVIIKSDRMRINRILLNLIGNAIKYTAKGSITIKVNAAPQLTISVSDTGEGIRADALNSIFDRFVKLHSSYKQQYFTGAGIGLHIAREFARDLGGDITVESEEGKGSCFTFSLKI